MKNWLNNKTIIITGASSGIGRELVKLFVLKSKANVIGIARNQDKLASLKEELGEEKHRFSYKIFDVSVEENWQNFAKELKEENIEYSLVINNAGVLPGFYNFLDMDISVGKKIMDTNFYSIVYSTKYLLPQVEERGGIANICSSDALLSVGGTSYYSASKAAVKAFTQSLQHENKSKYISCILPGFTDTNIFRDANIDEKEAKLIKKFVSPCDVISKKIYKAIIKRKKYKVVGYDAHVFSLLSRLMPKGGAKIINGVIKKAKIKLFDGVFK